MATVAQLIVQIDASTASLTRELQKANGDINKFAASTDKNIKAVDDRFASFGASVKSSLGAIGLAIGGVEIAKAFVNMADAATNMENRLRSVTGSAEELARAQGMLFASSQQNSTEMATSVELFTRISNALERTGISMERVVEITDTLQKITQLTGATTAESSAAMLQLSQAFNAGRLDGQEFNTMADTMPPLLNAVAEEIAKVNNISFDEARSSLKQMAADGEISLEILIKAVENMRGSVLEDFAEIEDTTAKAFTRMWNSVTMLAGAFNDLVGITSGISAFFDGISSGADSAANAMRGLAAVMSAIAGGDFQGAWGVIEEAQRKRVEARSGDEPAPVDAEGNPVITMTKPANAETEKPELKFYKAPSKEAKKAAKKAEDGISRDAERVFDSTRTAAEKYGAEISRLDELSKAGAISENTHIRALLDAEKDLQKATELKTKKAKTTKKATGIKKKSESELSAEKEQRETEQEAQRLFDATRTAAENYSIEIANLDKMLAKGAISQDVYNRAVEAAGESIKASDEKTFAYNEGLASLASMLASDAISQEAYNAAVSRLGKSFETSAEDGGELSATIQQIEEDLTAGVAVYESMMNASERYAASIKELDRLRSESAISQETYARATAAAVETLNEQLIAESEYLTSLNNMAIDLGDSFAMAFEDAVLSGKKLGDVLKGLWEDIQRIVMRNLVTVPLANTITNVLSGALVGGLAGGGAAGATAGVSGSGLLGLAKGGWVGGSGENDSILSLLTPGEFVVPSGVAKRNKGLLEGLPKFASGGWAGMAPGGAANNNAAPRIQVVLENKSGTPLKAEKSEQTRGPDGQQMIKVLVVGAVNDALRSGDLDRGMGARYGASVPPVAR